MKIIFCCNPIQQAHPDPIYEKEYNIAKSLDFDTSLICIEDLIYFNNPTKAIKNVPHNSELIPALYRGWMLTPEQYTVLYNSLLAKNVRLINSPKNYMHCHYLPESFETIKDMTAKTIWFDKNQLNTHLLDEIIKQVSLTFGSSPLIIKDYVKSRKHEWDDACYIADASDGKEVMRVLSNFLQRQGSELNKGIVFREFLKLSFLTHHHKSNMPLTKEFRLFFLHGNLMQVMNYWDEGEYSDLHPDVSQFIEVAKKIRSPFFTMDIALTADEQWVIIELGDGQVSGLPENANLNEFYANFRHIKADQ